MRVGADESNRLEVLRSLELLDTQREERFDRIVAQSRRIFGVPVAFISLLDSVRQWFKSAEGIEIENLSREVSFCDYVITANRHLVVEDLLLDPVLKTNPLVVSTPKVRFYAGVPLRVKGQPVGTLALLDVAPRSFAETEFAMLEGLAAWVETELQKDKLGELNQLLDSHRARYLTLFEESPLAIQVHDLSGDLCEKNDGAARLWKILGCDLSNFLTDSPFTGNDFAELFRRAAAGYHETVEPFIFESDDGLRTYLRAKLQPLRMGENVQQVVVILEDMTDTCALEENQRKLLNQGAERERQLQRARQDQENFYAILSHELRNPLTGILGISEMVRKSPESMTLEMAESLHSCAETLSGLIDDTLDIERISQGRLKLELEPFCPKALLESLVRVNQPSATAKGLRINLECTQDVGYVLGDRCRVSQILANLISNAIKYTSSGTINVLAGKKDQGLLFQVSDTGEGIAQERLESVFQPFFQVEETAADSRRGLGLGLSIVKNLVALMDGFVEVSSAEGAGSTFSVYLPLPDTTPPATSPTIEGTLSGRILIVDDNPVNQKILSLQLQGMGCVSSVAGDGVEALELLQRNSYDLVLMDCQMPRKDGFETASEIRLDPDRYGTPVIVALTASANNETRDRCLASGMDDYLQKPIRHQDLQQALLKNLEA